MRRYTAKEKQKQVLDIVDCIAAAESAIDAGEELLKSVNAELDRLGADVIVLHTVLDDVRAEPVRRWYHRLGDWVRDLV